MKSPSQQKIIQIDITNACPHGCGNCTHLCGHNKEPFFMTTSEFTRAVESLKNYSGMVGIIGGEPTIHPEFGKLLDIFESKRPLRHKVQKHSTGKPIEDFGAYRTHYLSNISHKRGLWTSLGRGYMKHYERIQEVFPYQCINDHANEGLHQSLLITREELGIPDDEWIRARDACWIQNLWSASINPNGAFFCEVAAALDNLFGGNTGWAVEDDWWRREPRDFGDQLQWCEMCSACLPVPRVKAHDKIDLVSKKMLDKLWDIGSPKIDKGRVHVFDTADYDPAKYKANTDNAEWYLPNEGDNSKRVAKDTSAILSTRKITAVTVCVGYDDYLDVTLPQNVKHFDQYIVVTTKEDTKTRDVCRRHGAECVLSARIHDDGAPFNKGKGMNDGIAAASNDWIQILDSDIVLPVSFSDDLNQLVLNPGFLYYTKRWGPLDENLNALVKGLAEGKPWHDLYHAYANRNRARKTDRLGNDIEHFPYGYFQLFNKTAKVLEDVAPKYYDEKYTTAEFADMHFGYTLYKGLTHSLPLPKFDVIHLPHGGFKQNWSGRVSRRIEEAVNEKRAALKVGVVVCHHQLPMKRLWEFFIWNAEVFERHGIKLYVVSDRLKDVPEYATCLVHSEPSTYSPSRASNVGIRAAVDAGLDIVVKTDIDCVLTEAFVEKVLRLQYNEGLAPYYMKAKSNTEHGYRGALSWDRVIGTLALYSQTWCSIRGYDERMEGYGREDGDGYERARDYVAITRDKDLIYHIDHPDRHGGKNSRYPMRRNENSNLVKERGRWVDSIASGHWGK